MTLYAERSTGIASRGAANAARGMLLFVVAAAGLAAAILLPGCSGCSTTRPAEQSRPEPPPEAGTNVDESPSTADVGSVTRDSSAEQPDDFSGETAEGSSGTAPGGAPTNPHAKGESGESQESSGDGKSTRSGTEATRGTPEEARARARDLQRQAKAAKEKRQFGKAFALTTEAWEAARAFPEDAECRRLAEQLGAETETLGSQANAEHKGEIDRSKTLIEK